MIKALFTAATGMQAQQMLVDNTANNLANVNTTGFKRSQVEFQDLLYDTRRTAGTQGATGQEVPTGIQLGSGTKVSGISKIFTPGTMENTGNQLDLAIQGDGFFRIQLPSGEFRFTRDGAFRQNSGGQLVTADGFLLTPPVNLPQDTISITVGTDGTVSVVTGGAANVSTTVGNIQLSRFANPAGLTAEGRNLFNASTASGQPQQGNPGTGGMGTLQQGFLERSNVEVVTELVRLITAQRAFEVSSRAIRTSDSMLETSNAIVR
jgi:flagellar basal-body rod protein FlgG